MGLNYSCNTGSKANQQIKDDCGTYRWFVKTLTDNDGDFATKITKKYKDFKDVETIKVFADDRVGLRTLEPQVVDANKDDLKLLCEILEIDKDVFNTTELISDYMIAYKTESALNIFNSAKSIKYPKYINDVINWCNEK